MKTNRRPSRDLAKRHEKTIHAEQYQSLQDSASQSRQPAQTMLEDLPVGDVDSAISDAPLEFGEGDMREDFGGDGMALRNPVGGSEISGNVESLALDPALFVSLDMLDPVLEPLPAPSLAHTDLTLDTQDDQNGFSHSSFDAHRTSADDIFRFPDSPFTNDDIQASRGDVRPSTAAQNDPVGSSRSRPQKRKRQCLEQLDKAGKDYEQPQLQRKNGSVRVVRNDLDSSRPARATIGLSESVDEALPLDFCGGSGLPLLDPSFLSPASNGFAIREPSSAIGTNTSVFTATLNPDAARAHDRSTHHGLPCVLEEKTDHVPQVDVDVDEASYQAVRDDVQNRSQHTLNLEAIVLRKDLSRFLKSYFDHFHRHLPIIHAPSLILAQCPSPLILGMSCIGALYRFDRRRAVRIYNMAINLSKMVGLVLDRAPGRRGFKARTNQSFVCSVNPPAIP